MAALDFPASPTDGQVYGNWVYSTSKGAWKAKPMVSAKTVTSDVAPSNPANGDQWLSTLDGTLYIYYVDVDGGQWVQVKNDASFSSTLGPRVDALDAGANTNYIINGAFDINQRGLTSTTSTGYGFDRWWFSSSGGTVTHSSQAFTLGSAPTAGYEAQNYARVVTSGQSAVSDLAYIAQRIEGVRTLAGQTATISFWAKAASGAPKISAEFNQWFGTGGSSETNTPSGSVTLSTSWARYSMTVNIPNISGKTIGTSDFLNVILWLSAGSTYSTRSSSIGIQNNTFDIWGVQVQAGSVATSFHRSAPTLQGELAACQRYYYRVSATASQNAKQIGFGWNYSTTAGVCNMNLPVSMRTAAISVDYSGNFRLNRADGQYAIDTFAVVSNVSSENIAHLSFNVTTGPAAGYIGRVICADSSSYVGVSAEL